MMSSKNILPAKCRECAKSRRTNIYSKCDICRMLEFQEQVLCDLNRCIQDQAAFKCHAFQPILKLVGTVEDKVSDIKAAPSTSFKEKPFLELLRSDKIKYERALALQKLSLDPDSVILDLKYHFAWNVSQRIPVFVPANKFIGFLNDIFLRCGELINGFVGLLYLAPDHIHLYVESDGELSVEEMVNKIKQFSNPAILKVFPFLKGKFDVDIEIWDKAYFVETVG